MSWDNAIVLGHPGSGAGQTDLQQAYDNSPTPGAQILLDTVPNPISIQAAVVGDIFECLDMAGTTIFKVEDDGANGLVSSIKNLYVRHIGMGLSTPTESHIIVGSEAFLFAGPGTAVGIGVFPRYVPAGPTAINNLYGMQGNVFFGNSNWSAGSTVAGLQFFPAPDYLSGSTSWGTAGTTFYGIQTGGCLNIFSRTITADAMYGGTFTPYSFIFGTAATVTANLMTGILIATPADPAGTVGIVTGLQVNDQDITVGTVTQGLWMNSDSQNGGDIVLGLGKDAGIWYDGTDLNIDPQRVGTGSTNLILRETLLGTEQAPPISPAALGAGNNNNWTGLLTNTSNTAMRHWARISGNATTSVLTGINATAAQDGDTFKLTNVSANSIDISHQDAASTAANRIISPTGATYQLGPDESCEIIYDTTTSRWRILWGSGA